MREVGEVAAQSERRERVDRLGDEQTAGTELRRGELEQPDERRRRQVLDDLRGEDAAERAVLESLEIGKGIGLLDVEAFALAYATMSASASIPRASTPASRSSDRNSPRPQPMSSTGAASRKSSTYHAGAPERLPSSRASAPRTRSSREGPPRPAAPRPSSRGGCRSPSRAARRAAAAPRAPRARGGSTRHPPCPVGRLVEVVDELEHRVVEGALLRRQRLDVPAEQRPQQPLDRIRDRALEARAPLQRPLGRNGPHALGLRAPGRAGALRAGAAAADLLAKLLEQRDGVDLRGRRSLCRRTIVPAAVRHGRMVLPACYGIVSRGTLARCASG